MGVHEAVAGFGKSADAYDRGRPGYPSQAVDWIVKVAGLGPGTTVVDLAAGTGKLTSALVASGARVIAVEPVAAMRARLAASLPTVEALDGTAENMPLRSGSADCVTVAQAFHWFSTDTALAEIARVLVPAGSLVLMWNRRDLDQPLQEEIGRIVAEHRHDTPSHGSGRWRQVIDASALFELVDETRVHFVHSLDREALVDRVASTSFIAELPDEERTQLLERVADLVQDEERTVDLSYSCEVHAFRLRG